MLDVLGGGAVGIKRDQTAIFFQSSSERAPLVEVKSQTEKKSTSSSSSRSSSSRS